MKQTYIQNTATRKAPQYTKSDIPRCFRQKTIGSVLLDYMLTAASIVGLVTALLFVIML